MLAADVPRAPQALVAITVVWATLTGFACCSRAATTLSLPAQPRVRMPLGDELPSGAAWPSWTCQWGAAAAVISFFVGAPLFPASA